MSIVDVANQWGDLVTSIAGQFGVDPNAILAIIAIESQGNPNARNLTGADAARGGSYGLMQMSYQTAVGYGYRGVDGTGLYDPTTNITLGVRYFRDCLAQVGGDLASAFSCYNSGSASGALTYANKALAMYNTLVASQSSNDGDGASVDLSVTGCQSIIVLGVSVATLAGVLWSMH